MRTRVSETTKRFNAVLAYFCFSVLFQVCKRCFTAVLFRLYRLRKKLFFVLRVSMTCRSIDDWNSVTKMYVKRKWQNARSAVA